MRFAVHTTNFKTTIESFQKPEGQEKLRKVRELTQIADGLFFFALFSLRDRLITQRNLTRRATN